MQYLTVQYLLAMESLKLLIMNLNILVTVTSNFFNPYRYVTRMEDGRIPKDMLYSELCLGTRPMCRQTRTTIQGCLQMGYESLRHRHLILGNCCPQPDHLEENHPRWDEEK